MAENSIVQKIHPCLRSMNEFAMLSPHLFPTLRNKKKTLKSHFLSTVSLRNKLMLAVCYSKSPSRETDTSMPL